MNSFFSIATKEQQTANALRTVKMSVLESELNSLLTQFSLSRADLQKPCDDNLFLALIPNFASFDSAAPYFNFTKSEIEVIGSQYNKENSRRLHMLWEWKLKNGNSATYLALVTIFQEMQDRVLTEFVLQYKFPIQSIDSYPNPQRITKYQNWDRMSDGEINQVKNDLLLQNQKVREKYAILTVDILHSFEKQNFNFDRLKIFLFSYCSHTSDMPLPPTTLANVFSILCSQYSSWFNIQLLKVVIKKYGSDDDERMLTTYEDNELVPYLHRSIFKMPSKSFAPGHESTRLKYLLFRPPDNQITTGQDIFVFQLNISRYLGINAGILQFISFEEGSKIFTFGIPEGLQKSIEIPFVNDSMTTAYNITNDELERIL